MANFDISSFLGIGLIISSVGFGGILFNKRSMLITLIAIELLLYGLDFEFIILSQNIDDLAGQLVALFLLTIAAAESAVALALIMSYFKNTGSILLED